jgi:hypothetical protein
MSIIGVRPLARDEAGSIETNALDFPHSQASWIALVARRLV